MMKYNTNKDAEQKEYIPPSITFFVWVGRGTNHSDRDFASVTGKDLTSFPACQPTVVDGDLIFSDNVII
jgi:hypothetical protein